MSTAPLKTWNINNVALFGAYPPRLCGIATFTKDLRDALTEQLGAERAMVLAMDEEAFPCDYPSDVRFQVRAHLPADYRLAADLLNINQIDVTFIQHEFGIYGGRDGALVLNLLRRLRMPIITTLHTVLKEPTSSQMSITREIAELSDRLIVMSRMGEEFLRDVYEIPSERIVFIPHGIPDVPFVDSSFYKDQFGLEGRTTLLTFGLMSRGKGIEHMLNAMPEVVRRHPEVTYVVLGATHPHVLREEGDAYRISLELLVDQLGMRDHVMFQNRFVTLEELCGYIGAADLYITPYLNKAQITSGTLAYSMGAGKAVVSSPYWYAEEMLSDGRGRIVPFRDSNALAEQVNDLLDNPVERDAMRKCAYLHCRSMIWKEVAGQYLEVASEVIGERRHAPRHVAPPRIEEAMAPDLFPDINLSHLRTLTDDTGVYQHAIYTIPDRKHGYCTDDNARALVAALRYHRLSKDESVLPLASKYLSFIHGAFDAEKRRFRNFMSFDRRWLEEDGSEDSHARAVWALGEAVAFAPNDGVLGYATRLFNDALPIVQSFTSPRSWAFALIGIHAYLRKFGGDSKTRRTRDTLARKLFGLFRQHASAEWPWCEDCVTWGNGRLPHALILCGQWLPDEKMLAQGLRTLEWLLTIQTNEHGQISPIGCDGWYPREGRKAVFDQQPVEIMGLVESCAEAYRCTGDARWGNEIRRCLNWFLGRNDMGAVLYDFKTGGCRDGLNPQGANQNEGAESTLSWLISLITLHELLGRHGRDDTA
jgi:glycosyltransferase involved in cell wall biosynthesis